jgi:hypothetical protein
MGDLLARTQTLILRYLGTCKWTMFWNYDVIITLIPIKCRNAIVHCNVECTMSSDWPMSMHECLLCVKYQCMNASYVLNVNGTMCLQQRVIMHGEWHFGHLCR